MQNTTDSVKQVLTNTKQQSNSSIGLKKDILNPIVQLDRLSHITVDKLLQDYADLIDVKYTSWFAKRFYTMSFDLIHQLASVARHDAKEDPKRLFVYLIKKNG